MWKRQFVWVTSLVSVLTVQAAWADSLPRAQNQAQPAKTVKEWVAQMEAAQDETPQTITGITVDRTETGLDIILETADGELLQIDPTQFVAQDASLIARISNAVLALPEGNEFQADNPTDDIAAVTVTQVDATTVQVSVTGNDAPLATEVTLRTGELAYSLNPGSEDDEEIVVTGDRPSVYRASNASSATRTDTPLRDIPAAIQVIPRQVIEDQQATDLDEALRNVSSVIYGGAEDTNTGLRYSIRGFDNAPVLIDGFRQFGFAEIPETTNLERIEVLKGPASILYGEIQPGGVINAITKQPLSTPFYEAELQVGSYQFVRPRIDFSGPLTTDGSVLYRLNTAYRRGGDFRGYDQEIEQFFISPVLTWRISDRTQITTTLQYQERERPYDANNTVAIGRGVADLPRDQFIGEPDDFGKREFLNVGYNLEHQFSDNWTLRNSFRYIRNSFFSDKLTIPLFVDEATGILARVYGFDDFQSRDYSLQTNVVGKFSTGSINHTLLLGVDLSRSDISPFIVKGDLRTIVPLNIFDPVYGSVPRPPVSSFQLALDRTVETNRLGIYVQDQIAFSDNFKALLGLRYDTLRQEATNAVAVFSPTGNDTVQTPDALMPRIGIVYQPIQPLSLYASYSQSFTPSNDDFDASGNPLEPEEGEGFEVGVKADLIRDRLFATLSYFDITKQNVATATNFPGVSVATGEQRSQGVELDLTGEIVPGWNIFASYTYTDAEVTEDNTIPAGNRLIGIPKHSVSVWTTYTIQTGSLEGLGFGLGVNYVSDREGDLANTFRLGSYFLTDAAIFYRRDNWRFAVNFKNIFNEKYYPGTPFSRVSGIAVGDPFTVIGSVSVQF
jgi:iron complex outermembrane recepter protein